MKASALRLAVLLGVTAALFLGAGNASAATSLLPGDSDFGNQAVGTESPTKAFTFTVSGQVCIEIVTGAPTCVPDFASAVPAVTGPFVSSTTCPGTLTSDLGGFPNSCQVLVKFAPAVPGPANGTLTVGPNSALLRGTGTSAGSGNAGGGALQAAQASNAFSFGGLKLNKHTGTATLTVEVPGPGDVSLGGSGLVKQRPGATVSKALPAAGKVKLKVKAKGRKKAKLNKTGKAKVKPKITFSPTGGMPGTQTRKITLHKNV